MTPSYEQLKIERNRLRSVLDTYRAMKNNPNYIATRKMYDNVVQQIKFKFRK